MATNRRLITKFFLELYGFEYDKEGGYWLKRFSSPSAYLWYVFKYYWKERKLEAFNYDCVGNVQSRYTIEDEAKIRKEIINHHYA